MFHFELVSQLMIKIEDWHDGQSFKQKPTGIPLVPLHLSNLFLNFKVFGLGFLDNQKKKTAKISLEKLQVSFKIATLEPKNGTKKIY